MAKQTPTSINTLDFLRACLAALDQPDDIRDPLEDLLRQRTVEDHRLDYKAGSWANSIDAAELRRDVSAFANAEGGVLIIGVSETKDHKTGEVRPTDSPEGCGAEFASCRRTVEHSLRALLPALSALPQLLCVQLDSGLNLFILPISRSENIVLVREGSEQVAYLRTGEGRHRMPEYLHADLVLGRRNRADLDVDVRVESLGNQGSEYMFQLSVTVTNVGLTWLPDSQVGCIGYASNHTDPSSGPVRSARLLAALSAPRIRRTTVRPLVLHQRHGAMERLAPFQSHVTRLVIAIPQCDGMAPHDVLWCGFAYIASQGEPPRRFSCQFRYDESGGSLVARPVVLQLQPEQRALCWWGTAQDDREIWDTAVSQVEADASTSEGSVEE